MSYDIEPGFDYVFVEAHHVGQDDWTTLPDANGHTSNGRRATACSSDWQVIASVHRALPEITDGRACRDGPIGRQR